METREDGEIHFETTIKRFESALRLELRISQLPLCFTSVYK